MRFIEGKSKNTFPQLVGSCITYFKRYAFVAYLALESEVDKPIIGSTIDDWFIEF